MKKIFILFAMMTMAITMNSQVLKVYKGADLVDSITFLDADKFVFKEITKITNISLSSAETITAGSGKILTATLTPTNPTISKLTWTSSDETVAVVSSSGIVTGIKAGTTTITATAKDGSGISATCTLTVNDTGKEHEYVDLGLPSGTLWATCNIGANSPKDYGYYFAWGETSGYINGTYGKTTPFNEANYKYCKKDATYDVYRYTKYVTQSGKSQGYNNFYDNLTTLEQVDDAASANWGGDWRMPSGDDWVELLNEDNCSRKWISNGDSVGIKITSKKEGYTDKSIFLPAAGHRYHSSDGNSDFSSGIGTKCYYWSSLLLEKYCNAAYYVSFYDHDYSLTYGGILRYTGQSVRPVKPNK